MNLSQMDEQEVRTYTTANPNIIGLVIQPEAEFINDEKNFMGEVFTVAIVLSFAKSLADILDSVETISSLIEKITSLFKWAQKALSGDNVSSAKGTTLSERILILVFEAYINRRAGIREDKLCAILAADKEHVKNALQSLETHGVIRKSRKGDWRYAK